MIGIRRGGRALGVALAVALMSTLSGSAAHASPLDLFGFGGRSPGMAGTGVATSTGYDAAWINPAGLADTPRKRVTFGYMAADFDLEMDDQPTGTESAHGFIFGGALPIPLGGALRDRIGFGIGFHVPPDAINRARHPFPGEPVFELLETRGHSVGIQAAVGAKVTDWLRLGGGVQALATLDGGIHVFTDAAGRFTTRSEQQLQTQFAPILGARLLAAPMPAQLGLVYRGEARTDYQLLITNDLLDSLPLTIPTLTIGGTSQFDPRTVALELAWQKGSDLIILGQLAWQDWSSYRLPTVNPVEGQAPQEEPGFHDIWLPRLAVQWTALSGRTGALIVRGGYHFVNSPAPEMDGRQSMLDNDRDVFSGGLGLYLPGTSAPIHLDLWMQLHVLGPRRHTKDLSVFMPGETVPFYTTRTSGQILVGGLTMGVDL